MAYRFSMLLSVPQLQERYEDYREDLLQDVAGLRQVRCEGGHGLLLEFEAGSASAEDAMRDAAAAVRLCLPAARLQAYAPDTVRLAEMEPLVGLSEACLAELRDDNPATFPPPVPGREGCWNAIDLLLWIRAVGGIHVDVELLEVARSTAALNDALRARRLGLVA